VDGDLHNPCLHRAFGLPNEHGLANVLMGQAPLSGVVQTTTVPGVSLLASGPLPPSPADLVTGEQAKALIREINQAADVVIWDTPPAAILPEATIIGEQADGVLFVVGRQAKRRPVRQTLSALEGVGVRVVGLLPNQVRPAGGYYYYYSPYYYRHRDEPDQT
jgi:non-specific protein-tyrosine kinase